MRTFSLSLFLLCLVTASARAETPKNVELVFVIDTTASMGGLIEGAKQKVWSVINEVQKDPAKPKVKVGLVAYRDHGDSYVTKVFPLSSNLDEIYTKLMALQADGGGDGPEDVRQALSDGVRKAGWAPAGKEMRQILFLVGDAEPHDDYAQEPDTLASTKEAIKRGILVNAIQCGNAAAARQAWQAIARAGEGKYFAIQQDGGVAAIETPFDKRLAELGAKSGETYIGYGKGGSAGLRMAAQAKTESYFSAAASSSALADRAVNKALNSDAYEGDLVQLMEEGAVSSDSAEVDSLPAELQKLSPKERKEKIEAKAADRRKIQAEILELSKKRDKFLEEARRKAGKTDGFDVAVSDALKTQLKKR